MELILSATKSKMQRMDVEAISSETGESGVSFLQSYSLFLLRLSSRTLLLLLPNKKASFLLYERFELATSSRFVFAETTVTTTLSEISASDDRSAILSSLGFAK